ncbi:type 2 isopentenyl-diphosphate Delta-isomerase [Bacillus marasmi]|uniref:type 2 isopentenyl-diphosphate Delta-isomerase n=1 Tax=Bacillus marasmi TaxID=1926279 RepID=UPI0011C9523E|nr:type 2 isopentenyl-diphosphate Delta-isomerase [Bacillus marasmi]
MTRSERKWDHIRLALTTANKRQNSFEDIAFVHRSLPNTSLDQINISTKIGELLLSSPIFINAMTGGGGPRTYDINQHLAHVANEMNLAMAVGSQMAALKDKREQESFRVVRKVNPKGIIFGNLGWEATVEQAKQAVDLIEANALQIHVNAIQELTMPEGDRNFSGALSRIEAIINSIGIPVIVKEVGFGMSRETVKALASIGVSAVDVGGFGGTNFAKIENERRNQQPLSFFNEWGIPTAASIVEAKCGRENTAIIGSGGIRTSLDVAKAIALGANAVGIAGRFLKILLEQGVEPLIDEVTHFHQELAVIMTALGAKTVAELQAVPLVMRGETHHWLTERGMDTKQYSQRG